MPSSVRILRLMPACYCFLYTASPYLILWYYFSGFWLGTSLFIPWFTVIGSWLGSTMAWKDIDSPPLH